MTSPGCKQDVSLRLLTLHNVFVVERMFHLLAVFGAQNVNAFDFCELRETAGTGQRLQHGHAG